MTILALAALAEGGIDLNQIYGFIIQSGVVGAFLLLFLFGKIRREGEVLDVKAELAENRLVVKTLTEHYQKEVIPALIDTTRVAGELVAYLNKHRD